MDAGLRVPAWSATARVRVAGGEWAGAGGYVRLRREWRPGDRVELELDMAPRLVAPHPRIDAVRGCLAIERGPLVYSFEQADHGSALDDLTVCPAGPLRDAPPPDALPGIVAVEASGRHAPEPTAAPGRGRTRRSPPVHRGRPGTAQTLLAVPYFAWGNRGAGAMRVWIPVSGPAPLAHETFAVAQPG